MLKLRGRHVFIAVVALVLAVGIWVAASPASAAGPGVWKYYSDAKYKTQVGARGTGCCGETISWGSVTSYAKYERLYCLDVLCPQLD